MERRIAGSGGEQLHGSFMVPDHLLHGVVIEIPIR
jgi:hypothetical protein